MAVNQKTGVRVVGIIPARYASTRLPGKPLIELCGKSMVQHVYERAKQSKLLNCLMVATDDERISSAVRGFGGEVVMTPLNIRSGSDRLAHVARSLDVDVIVNIQCDEPLIHPKMIDETIQPLLKDITIYVATLAKRITKAEELTNPAIPKVIFDKEHFALYFTRSVIPFLRDHEDVEKWITKHSYYKHIGLYVYRKDFLLRFAGMEETPLERAEQLEQLRILENGLKIKVVLTNHESVSVDTPEDLEFVKTLMLKN